MQMSTNKPQEDNRNSGSADESRDYLLAKKTIRVDDAAQHFAKYVEGDQIWGYNDMAMLSGTGGYILVRDGHVIDVFVTAMS